MFLDINFSFQYLSTLKSIYKVRKNAFWLLLGMKKLNLRPLRGPVVVNSMAKCTRKFIDVVFLKRYTGVCVFYYM